MGIVNFLERRAADMALPGSGVALGIVQKLRPALPYVIVAVAIASALLFIDHRGFERGFHRRDPELAGLHQQIADRDAAGAKAAAANLAHVRAVETRDAQITKEQTDVLSHQLVDARTAVAAYVERLRDAQARAGHAGADGLSQTAPTAGPADGGGQSAVVPVADLEIAAENTVKAQAWRDWWSRVSAIQSDNKGN